jgi:hypothetical protein
MMQIEFREFLSQLTDAICSRLSTRFPTEAVEAMSGLMSSDEAGTMLSEIIRAWIVHGFQDAAEARYDEAVSIMLIHLIGPMNRLRMPTGVDRVKLLSAYMSLLDGLLQQDLVKRRFANLCQRALLAA